MRLFGHSILLALVAVISLRAPTINAGFWSNLVGNINYGGLNKWLVNGLPAVEDVAANMAFIKANSDQLPDAKVKRAAEVLSKVLEATECSADLLASVGEIRKLGANGNERVKELVRLAISERLDGVCGDFLDESVAKLYATSLDIRPKRLVEALLMDQGISLLTGTSAQDKAALSSSSFLSYTGDPMDSSSMKLTVDQWAQLMYSITKDERNCKVNKVLSLSPSRFHIHRLWAAFDRCFEKYLRLPCLSFEAVFGGRMDDLNGLAQLRCPTGEHDCNNEFMSKRSDIVKGVMYAFKQCKTLPKHNNILHTHPMYEPYADYEDKMEGVSESINDRPRFIRLDYKKDSVQS